MILVHVKIQKYEDKTGLFKKEKIFLVKSLSNNHYEILVSEPDFNYCII